MMGPATPQASNQNAGRQAAVINATGAMHPSYGLSPAKAQNDKKGWSQRVKRVARLIPPIKVSFVPFYRYTIDISLLVFTLNNHPLKRVS